MKPHAHPARVAALGLAAAMLLSMTSCASVWNWLWSRDSGMDVDSGDLILGDGHEEVTEPTFEGAVEYTGEAHSGTDIYYLGKKGHKNSHRIIVIDAGHQLTGSSTLEPNGPDSEVMKAEVTWGATGVYTGSPEYELNLRVALLLRDELIRRGYSVVMIRETNNVSISNMKRALIANKYEAAAYVRIHANSWTDESMQGAMTICQSAANPYPTCAALHTESRRLSELVLDEFCAQTGIKQLSLREMDDMTGTNWSLVPTTIVEMGFLSNTSDDRLMATDYFRQEAAIGIANGLDAYFEEVDAMEAATGRADDQESNGKTDTVTDQDAPVATPDNTPETAPPESVTQSASDSHPPADAPEASPDAAVPEAGAGIEEPTEPGT